MRIKPNISLVLRLVSCSDPNLCFVNSSSHRETFAFVLRHFVRLHCKEGERTDAGFGRHPATPNPRAVWRVACKGLHHHRAPSKICSKTNITHCPHQQKLLLGAHRHGAALKGASTTAWVSGNLVRAEPREGSTQPRKAQLGMDKAPAQPLCPNSP